MPNTVISRDRVNEEVVKALAATLRIEESTIDLDTSVVNGLSASSLDFLDINFRLENTFGIRLASQLLLDHVEEELGEGKAIDANNQITEPAAELLKLYFGEAEGLTGGMYADEIPALVTPRIVADGVWRILEELPESCPSCGATEYRSEDGTHVVCAACGAEAAYPDGDTLVKAWIHEVQKEKQLF